MNKTKAKLVHVWDLRCWKCASLKNDFAHQTLSCPQNVFRDGELFPEDFGVKCAKFTLVKTSKTETFTKAKEIALKELIDKKIAEALAQHEDDYEHKEKMLTSEEIEKEAKP